MNLAAANSEFRVGYRGLRGWLDQVEKMGELQRVNGAHWDVEMGAITHMLTEKSRGTAPAILFDDMPGYPEGYRTLYGQFSSIRRIALTLGLPLEHDRKVDIVQRYHERMRDLEADAAALRQGRADPGERARGRRRRRAQIPGAAPSRAGQRALHRHRRLRDDQGPRRRLVQSRRLSLAGL